MASSGSSRGERTSERSARAARAADRGYCDMVLWGAIRPRRSAVAGNRLPDNRGAAPFLESDTTTFSRLARRFLIVAVAAVPSLLGACKPLSPRVDEALIANPSAESCAVAVAAAPKDSTLVKVRVALAFAERGPDVRSLQRSVLSDVLSQV